MISRELSFTPAMYKGTKESYYQAKLEMNLYSELLPLPYELS